jgi:gluconokinase
MILIVMGVSGSGKTTVGRALASALSCEFSDADKFHSSANIAKMSRGVALTDEDRAPWLASMRAAIEHWAEKGGDHVLACSALKERYREALVPPGVDLRFVYLRGDFDLLARRLGERKGHFFDPALLRTQFEALEEPQNAIVVDVDAAPADVVATIVALLRPATS